MTDNSGYWFERWKLVGDPEENPTGITPGYVLEVGNKLIKELNTRIERLERTMAIAMYREQLQDVNADIDDFPTGLTTNLGELDWQAEKLLRAEWALLSSDRQTKLLRSVGDEALVATEEEQKWQTPKHIAQLIAKTPPDDLHNDASPPHGMRYVGDE